MMKCLEPLVQTNPLFAFKHISLTYLVSISRVSKAFFIYTTHITACVTDFILIKGYIMASKPRHKEPTNFEHCCSCCNVMAKEIKQLKEKINTLNKGDIMK